MEVLDTRSLDATGPARIMYTPYVGLRAYRPEERDWFFGRDQDAELLFHKILASPLTILYSQSGLGKSSLLQALVIPRLKESGALVVDFDEWARDSPTDALHQKLLDAAPTFEGTVDGRAPSLLGLAQWISRTAHQPVILVLDQFEEFLTRPAPGLDPLRKEIA